MCAIILNVDRVQRLRSLPHKDNRTLASTFSVVVEAVLPLLEESDTDVDCEDALASIEKEDEGYY